MEIRRQIKEYNQKIRDSEIYSKTPIKSEDGTVVHKLAQQKMNAALNDLIKSLKPGQVFSAEISDIRNTLLELTLGNQQKLMAQSPDGMEYSIGQQALFMVKENNGQQLILKPAGSFGTPEQSSLLAMSRALTAAELPVNERNLMMIKTMMEEQLPVDKQSVLAMMKEVIGYPDVDISTLVSLQKYKVPITPENVTQYENYKNNEHQLLSQMQKLNEDMGKLILDSIKTDGAVPAKDLLNSILDILLKNDPTMNKDANQNANTDPLLSSTDQDLSDEKNVHPLNRLERQSLSALIKELGDFPVLQKAIFSKQATPELLMSKIQEFMKSPEFPTDEFQKLFDHPSFQKLLDKTMEHSFLLEPRQLEEDDGLTSYYKKIAQTSERLEGLMQDLGKADSSFSKSAVNMSQNLKFMQSINETLNYIQLPLKFTEQQAHGELYVYSKKNLKHKKDEELTALLRLDMENLGQMDVFVRLTDQKVSTNFTLESEEMLDFIEQHIDLLDARLTKKGYQVSVTVKKKTETELIASPEEFIKKENPTAEIKRFSFDVRA